MASLLMNAFLPIGGKKIAKLQYVRFNQARVSELLLPSLCQQWNKLKKMFGVIDETFPNLVMLYLWIVFKGRHKLFVVLP